ncbi:MAG: hypothetical protein SGJ19_01595 [Planctomycetia bacterium]|nr:hypothetical protein [Planctomycetia bacterium]
MAFRFVLWDLDADPHGNVQHCLRHHVSKEEVEYVLSNPTYETISRSSGYPIVFGVTAEGRQIFVVFERIDDDTVYPVTAFDAN